MKAFLNKPDQIDGQNTGPSVTAVSENMLKITCYKFQILFMNQPHPLENGQSKSIFVLGLM
jgi:hypothetical protein